MNNITDITETPRTAQESHDLEVAMGRIRRASSTLRTRSRRADPQDVTALTLGVDRFGEGDPELSAELLALMTPKVARALADLMDVAAGDCISIGDTSFLRLADLILEVTA